MPSNPEADIKQLRMTVDALSRKLETLEKQLRALPDLSELAKLVPRMDAAEKAIAGKKDIKPEHEQALKVLIAANKEAVNKAMLEARFNQADARLATLDAQVKAAIGLAQGAMAKASSK